MHMILITKIYLLFYSLRHIVISENYLKYIFGRQYDDDQQLFNVK